MARRRNRMTEEKKNVIAALMQAYDVQTAEDVQDALKDLLGGTLEEMLKAEMKDHLGISLTIRSRSSQIYAYALTPATALSTASPLRAMKQ